MKVQVNGITVHYEDQGAGTAVLLVHAFPLSGSMWQPQLDALTSDVRLIVPDLRGFGASDVPQGPYTMDVLADDLAALLDHLEIQQVVLGGLSMGGYVAFAFLRRHAARVRALVLADTRASADIDQAKATRESNAQLAETEGAQAIANQMLASLLTRDAASDLKASVRTLIERNNPHGIAGALRGMALRPESSSLLPTIQVPTLLLVGQQDSLTTPGQMQTMQEAIPGSQLVEIPSAAHLSNMENPTAFNTALADFVRSLD